MEPAAAYLMLVLAGSPAMAEPVEARATLVWRDLAGLPSEITAAARGEVERLYAAAGVRVTWSDLGESSPPALPVIVMDADSRSLRLPREVMGVSRPGGDAAWIVYGALLRTLGLTKREAHRPREVAAVGRALGRVIAHEVVHALARPHAHAKDGLMRARLGRTALLAADIEWDEASRLALVNGLLASNPPSTGGAPAALAEDADEGEGP